MTDGTSKVIRVLSYSALILFLLGVGFFVVRTTTRYFERRTQGTKSLDGGDVVP